MERVTITLSKQLAERLAGGEKDQRKRTQSKINKETLALIKEDEEIRNALYRSKRVGKLLLKREDEEMEKLNQLTEELSKKPVFNPDLSPDPCQASREACASCCHQSSGKILDCVGEIEAYRKCAHAQFVEFLHQMPVHHEQSFQGKV